MSARPRTFRFRSDLFAVDPKEDEETNPFCYGRAMAEWVSQKFAASGYVPEPVIAEDWGWCVMLKREPFMLWVGCGNERSTLLKSITPKQKETYVPDGRDLTWCCFVSAEAPIWTSFFWRRLAGRASTAGETAEVERRLERFLREEPAIRELESSPNG